MARFLLLVVLGLVSVACSTQETPDVSTPPVVTREPLHGAANAVLPVNSDFAQVEIGMDLAPTPLVFDAAVPLADGGSVAFDGGPYWAPPAGRTPKGILLDTTTTATKGTVYLDMQGNGGAAGVTNQAIPLVVDVVHRLSFTRIYGTNITDGGLTPYVVY